MMMKMFMKKYLKHIVLATLFVVCAVTTIWAINYDKSTTPLNNEITSGISGPINVPVQTVVNGVATVNSTVNGVSYGQTITVNAPLVAGQVFLHWFDGARNKILSYQESYNYRVLSATPDLRAVYIAEGAMRVIFIDANENQIAVGVPTPNGGGFTVTAPAANLIPVRPGYAITGWSEDLNNIQLDLAGRAYVQAIYTRNSEEFPELLTVHIEDTLYGSFDFGTVTTVTTPETKGEEVFSHWTIDGRTVSYSRTYSFTVHRDTVLIPVYSETYEPVEISYLDPNYFEYDFGYNKQVTFVGRYELPWDWELVETGVLFYDGTISGELTLETNNVRKVQSTNQNNNNEFTITTLNRTVFSPYHARSYLVFNDGFDYIVVYGELITIDALEQTGYFYDFEGVTKGSYASGNITLGGISWNLTNVVVGTLAGDAKIGSKSLRFWDNYDNNTFRATFTSTTAISGGINQISFYYAKYGNDVGGNLIVQIAPENNPNVWSTIHTVNATNTALTPVVINVHYSNSAYVRLIAETGSSRINVDNFSINPVPDTVGPVFSGLSNKEIIVGSSFNPMSGVTALDAIDGNVTNRITYQARLQDETPIASIDTNVIGIYYVDYFVDDYSENSTTQRITVEVVDISDSAKADLAVADLDIPSTNTEYTQNFTLPVTGLYGSTVVWESSNAAIVVSSGDALVTRPTDGDVTVRLSWALSLNDEDRSGYVDVIVKAIGAETIIYSTGFESSEGFTAGSNYQLNRVLQGPVNEQWYFYFGTTSTNVPITGAQSAQMRWYSTSGNSLKFGYIESNFTFSDVTKVTFNAKTSNNHKVSVSYSVDGTNFIGSQEFTLTSSYQSFTYNINVSGNIKLKFDLIQVGTTSGSNVVIDDIDVYGTSNPS